MSKEKFKQYRQELGLSQAQLAEQLGWTDRQVSNIETGARAITKQTELAIECLLRRSRKWKTK